MPDLLRGMCGDMNIEIGNDLTLVSLFTGHGAQVICAKVKGKIV